MRIAVIGARMQTHVRTPSTWKHFFLACAFGVAGLTSPASAETKTYYTDLRKDKSPSLCERSNSHQVYTVDISNGMMALANENGKQFTIPVPADGNIQREYKSAAGGSMEITGNVTTGIYELYNRSTTCRYRLVPK